RPTGVIYPLAIFTLPPTTVLPRPAASLSAAAAAARHSSAESNARFTSQPSPSRNVNLLQRTHGPSAAARLIAVRRRRVTTDATRITRFIGTYQSWGRRDCSPPLRPARAHGVGEAVSAANQ